MNRDKDMSADAAELRRRAEEKLAATGAEAQAPAAEQDALRLVHELQVHQIELEMQNDELRLAHADAETNLDLYTDLYDFAPVGYFTLDRLGTIRRSNLTGATLLGVERSKLVDRRFRLLVSPETRPGFNAFLDSTFEHSKRQVCDAVMLTGTGMPISVRIEGAAPANSEECRIAVIDLTEHMRADRELRESREFAQSTIDSLSAHLCVLDERGIILAVNKAWLDSAEANAPATGNLGIGADYLGVCNAVIGPESEMAQVFAAGIRRVLSGAQAEFEMEYPCHSPHVQRWFVARVTHFAGIGSHRVAIAHENITQRKLSEESLRQSEERLSTAVASGSMGIWGLDLRTNTSVWDARTHDMFGIPRETAPTHEMWLEMVVPEDRTRAQASLERVIAEKCRDLVEYRIAHPDGSIRYIQCTTDPVLDETGAVRSVVGLDLDITERKLAEIALRESEARLRTLVQTIPDLVWLKNKDGVYLSCNPMFERFFGAREEEIVGKTDYDFVNPELADSFREHDRNALIAGKPTSNEEWVTFSDDGHRVLLETIKTPMFDTRGKLIGVLGIGRDITARKQAEEALREREERYRVLFDRANDGVFVITTEGMLIEVNESFARMHGYSQAELLQMSLRDLDTPESINRMPERMSRLLAGEPLTFEVEHFHKDGHIFPLEVSASVIAQGGQSVVQCFHRDITERKQAEEALRESEERHRTILHTAIDGFWLVDMQGRILEVNEAYCRMSGYSEQELLSMRVSDLEASESDEDTADQIRTVVAQGEKRFDSQHRRKDGSLYDVAVSLKYQDAEGGRIVAFLQDITRRKLAQEALRESEARFRSLFEAAPDAIFVQSEGRFVYVNEAMVSLLGASCPEDLLGKEFMDRMAPEYRDGIVQRIQSQCITGEPAPLMDQEYLRLDGSRVPVETTAVAIGYQARGAHLVFVRDVTARKQAQEALQESEARLRGVIFSTADWVWEADEKGVYTFSSQKGLELLGRSPESIIGKTPFDFMDSKERKRVGAIFKKIAADKAPIVDLENWNIKENGERVCLLTNGVPILDNEGSLKGYRGVDKDITERKQAESELLLNHEMQNAMGSLLRLSMEKRTDREFMDRALKLILSLEWLAFESRGAIFLADEANKLLRVEAHRGFTEALSSICATVPYGRCICGKAAETRTTQFVDRVDEAHDTRYDGMKPHGHYCVPILSGDHVLGVLALYVKEGHKRNPQEEQFLETMANSLATAIERRRGEEALRESEEKYRELFARMMNGLAVHEIILDDNGVPVDYRFLGVNPTFERLTGLKAQDIIGRTVREVLPGTEPTWVERYGRVALTGEQAHFEDYSSDLGRSYSVSAYRSAPGQFACVIEDITERKQAEEEILRLNDSLEERVVQRTAELETANSELRSFGYSVSHDLRAPIIRIDGMSLALLEDYGDRLDDQGKLFLGRVRSEAQRMGQLVDDLLKLSRVNRAEMQVQTLDISGLALGVCEDLKEANLDRDIEFIVEPGLSAKGDGHLLEIVLVNLLGNAVKFTSKRERARVEFGRTTDNGRSAFYVKDNGAGFDMAYSDKLFAPFQRMHADADYPGTGVGLATVQRIIRRHGGEVWANARVDAGATFHFTIPDTANPICRSVRR